MNSKRRTILIVDDESYIREFLGQILSESFRVVFAQNGYEALSQVLAEKPDAMILDMSMPGPSGLETCQTIRLHPDFQTMPILFVTAANEPQSRIRAFKAGGDDYISKPFLPEELMARLVRKLESVDKPKTEPKPSLALGDINLQLDSLTVQIQGRRQELASIEFKILSLLLRRQNELISRHDLNTMIWGSNPPSERALDPHITSLRKKLRSSQCELKTLYGKGYCLVLRPSKLARTALSF